MMMETKIPVFRGKGIRKTLYNAQKKPITIEVMNHA